MPGPNTPALTPGFILPPTPFRPVDVLGAGPNARAQQSSAALSLGRSWYVRSGGSNSNGGSSTSLTPERNGSDGVANNTTTFTSATAAFTSADVGKGICVSTGGTARHHKIVSINSGTSVVLDRVCTLNASGQAWAIGGAWADYRAGLADAAANGDSNSPLAGGDTLWIGAGTYRVVLNALGTNWKPSAMVYVVGDVTGAATGDAGMVQVTAATTNDRTVPTAAATLAATATNLTFANLFIVGGNTTPSCVSLTPVDGRGVSLLNCSMIGAGLSQNTLFGLNSTPQGPANILVDRCLFMCATRAVAIGVATIILTRAPGSDYNCGVVIQNSRFWGGAAATIRVQSAGAGTGLGGGLVCRNNSFFGAGTGAAVLTSDANLSVSIPVVVTGCVVWGLTTGLSATTSGQIVESYNYFACNTPRTNVSIGPGSFSGAELAPLFSFGQEVSWGGNPRPFGEPLAGSPLTAFGDADTAAGLDARQGPRPSSSPRWDVGAVQRGNNFGKETSLVNTGTNAISAIGDGFQDFDLAVAAGPLTVSVYCQFDANYTGPLPQLQVVKGGQVGVGDVQVNFSNLANSAWEQKSITINPTAAGIVTIRVVSGDTSGISKVVFDTFAAA